MQPVRSVLELLTNPHFQARPGMYAGNGEFPFFGGWLRGLVMGWRIGRGEEPDGLDGFREWLVMKLDGPSNTGDWVGVICAKYGNGTETTKKCFELLNEFVAERAARGVDAIVQEHAEYERQRYGRLSTSRRKETP
jgi:hypothetical protein